VRAIHACAECTQTSPVDGWGIEARLPLPHVAGVHAGDIDIVVTACGAYCPTPSLSAMLVNKFGMRSDVISYSLGGMGCSSGVLGLQLVADLLQVRLCRTTDTVLLSKAGPAT